MNKHHPLNGNGGDGALRTREHELLTGGISLRGFIRTVTSIGLATL